MIRLPTMLRRTTIPIALALLLAAPARADRAGGLRPAADEVVVAPGGAIFLPLGAERPGDRWPARVDAWLADGTRISGHVAWVSRGAARRSFAERAVPLTIRPIRDDDDTADPQRPGVPYLVAALPAEAVPGPVRLLGEEVQLRWHSARRPYSSFPLPAPDAPRLEVSRGDDRPDPDDPFEHWRWVLLGDRLDRRAPALERFDPISALVAQHHADLWRIALARIAEESPAIAATCRDLLTATARDGDRPFAAWTTDPAALARLLDLGLDATQHPTTIAREALAWCDAREPLLLWADQETGPQVVIWAVNRTPQPIIARWRWLEEETIPVAVELAPGRLDRIIVDRPAERAGDVARGSAPTRTLRLETDRRRIDLAVAAPVVPARPPACAMPPFRPTLILAEIEAGRQAAVDPTRATSMQIRLAGDAWEVFFECRRPAAAQGSGESITLLVGPRNALGRSIVVPEIGDPVVRGDDRTPTVHRRSWEDRWYARIVLPLSWLAPDPDSLAVPFGALRRHGDGDAVETTPTAALPWRPDPGRVAVDLYAWE